MILPFQDYLFRQQGVLLGIVGDNDTLQVIPYYNKPSQEGLYRYFATIAEEVDLPMVLYNIPGRCSVNMAPQTVMELALQYAGCSIGKCD